MKYNWTLAKNNFSWLDRLKICKFWLTPSNFWTQNKYVRQFEELAANYVGCKYAVFVSSGSTANQLIAQKVKDDLIESGKWETKKQVILGAISWQTNASVWVREGFEPVFLDISMEDFCLDYQKLEDYLSENYDKVACVFPTHVLGYAGNVEKVAGICDNYGVGLKWDCCEASESRYKDFYGSTSLNVCNGFTCSTSVFVAHIWSNGQEGGFIFTNNSEEYKYYLLSRAHGLLRNLITYKDKLEMSEEEIFEEGNELVHPQFDFQTLSSNYRSTECCAFTGILDYKKWTKHKEIRDGLYQVYRENLDPLRYYLPKDRPNVKDLAFCFPVICRGEGKEERVRKVDEFFKNNNIQSRSFVSGNMVRQLPYQKYGDYKTYKNAEELTLYARYFGLNVDLKESQIINVCDKLNKL